MKDKEQVFTNIQMALKEVFDEVESYHVEHLGRDITVKVPSDYFQPINWNGKGLNNIVNVKLEFESAHPNHVEDKVVKIDTYVKSLFATDEWYGIDVSNVEKRDKDIIYNKMCERMASYFSALVENYPCITKGEQLYGYIYGMDLLLDNFDDYENALENARFLKEIITNLEQKVAEVVEMAKKELQQKIDDDESEYQRIKAQRHAPNTVQISIKDIISQIKDKDLSQEQMIKILEVIK
jgi:hypothetical protein